MARTHEHIEKWVIPADKDQWEVVRAADAYLRVRIGLKTNCHAAVYDQRGSISEDGLDKCHVEWQRESSPLKSVVIFYGDTTDSLSAQLHAKDLDNGLASGLWKPNLEVTVRGDDAAEVRGIAQEAVEKAKGGFDAPRMRLPQLEQAAHAHVERPTLVGLSEKIAAPTSGFTKVMNHPWVYSTGTALIAGLVILALTIWLT